MADVFDQYAMAEAWDEMFARPGEPRAAYRSLFAALQPLSVTDLRSRADQLARVFTDRGVTFAYAGEERPFPLDLVPRILDAAEWDLISRAVRQRVLALEQFLADIYGPGRVLAGGVDLIRDEQGQFRVLEDNLRIPSGVSYVLENRRAMSQTLPGLFAEARVTPVDEYPSRLLAALRAAAPEGVADPCVVVLTPGA